MILKNGSFLIAKIFQWDVFSANQFYWSKNSKNWILWNNFYDLSGV